LESRRLVKKNPVADPAPREYIMLRKEREMERSKNTVVSCYLDYFVFLC